MVFGVTSLHEDNVATRAQLLQLPEESIEIDLDMLGKFAKERKEKKLQVNLQMTKIDYASSHAKWNES